MSGKRSVLGAFILVEANERRQAVYAQQRRALIVCALMVYVVVAEAAHESSLSSRGCLAFQAGTSFARTTARVGPAVG
jgi:hypothetical protein